MCIEGRSKTNRKHDNSGGHFQLFVTVLETQISKIKIVAREWVAAVVQHVEAEEK